MDYRDSHLERGTTYDARLASDPFDTYMAEWESQYVRAMLQSHFPSGIPRYLDFACGTGRLTSVIAPLAAEAVGVDISESMLASARTKLPSVKFVFRDLTAGAAPDLGKFDLVSSFRFFGNAQDELRLAVMRTINRLLANGGHLLINNHRNPNAIASLLMRAGGLDHGMDLTHRKLYGQLENAGFELVERRPIGAWMYRSRAMNSARADGRREQRLEKIFGSGLLAPLAPDAVILMRKVRDLTNA